jgi:integrase
MSAPMVRTRTPGIYKRGSRYVYTWRDANRKLRRRSAATMAEAKWKRGVEVDKVRRGVRSADTRVEFADYAKRWIREYPVRRGISPETAEDYRRALGVDGEGDLLVRGRAVDWFGRTPLVSIGPGLLREYATHVAATGVSRNTVRLRLAPVLAILATAHADEIITSNPAAGLRDLLPAEPHASGNEGEGEHGQALDPVELGRLLDALPEGWRELFEFLAETGLRFSEACEVRFGDLHLDDELHPRLYVQRRFYRGRVDRPKGRKTRWVPLTRPRAAVLRALREETGGADDDLVFRSASGGRISHSNLMRRVLKPAAVEAGLGEWVETAKGKRAVSFVGMHTFRKTCGTRLLLEMDPVLGRPWVIDEVQVMLGHADRTTTARYYIHVDPETLPAPRSAPAGGANRVGTGPTEIDRNAARATAGETA